MTLNKRLEKKEKLIIKKAWLF